MGETNKESFKSYKNETNFSELLSPNNEQNIAVKVKKNYTGMPKKALEAAGYGEENLIGYEKEGKGEYMTFFDQNTLEKGDNITFYVVDDKTIEWFEGKGLKGI